MKDVEPETGFTRILGQLLKDSISLGAGILNLAVLEFQLAGKDFFTLICLSVLGGIFFLSSWLFFSVAVALKLVSLNFSWQASLCFLAAFNLVLFLTAVFFFVRVKRNIRFSGIRKQLGFCGENNENTLSQPLQSAEKN